VVVHTSFKGHAFTVALQRVDGQWKMSDVLCEFDEVSDAQTEGWQVFADEVYGFQIRFPAEWTFEEGQLLPPEETPDAQKALKRLLFFQPRTWEGVAPPLHIQLTVGTHDEFARLYVPASVSEHLIVNGLGVIREREDLGSGMEVIRYIFPSPTDETVRVVAVDYLSGFPERAAGQAEVIDALQQMLYTIQLTK
jgi:hypothetical protein